jgi:predicted nucleic acid-binding Zn ribbon protein
MNRPPFRNPPLGPPRSGPRQKILAAWRGVDTVPLEKSRKNSAKTAEQLVPGVLKNLGLDQRRAEAEIVKVWNNLIDPNITAHAQPAGVHKGTLFVNVDSSVWLSEIVRYRRREILAQLQQCFGKEFIAKISFRAG